ncbi:ferredoxin--NAD(+) reductase, partial [Methylobacterium trifolii]
MSARCSLVVNGKAVRVSTGDTPLEAALAEGMIAPTQGLHGTLLLRQAMRERDETAAHAEAIAR